MTISRAADKLEAAWWPPYCPAMEFLDLDAIRRAPSAKDPFPYFIVPGGMPAAARAAVSAGFPRVEQGGSFPVSSLEIGPTFAAFLEQLQAPAFRDIVADKLGIDLRGRPTMVTIRGRSEAHDGGIHSDSKSKLVTVLIYMNESWDAPGGRLRLLRSPDDLDDMVAEVPPDAGTLVAFAVTPHSWHGHAPAPGPRRVVQLNWVTDESVVRREQTRHRLSARVKRLLAFAK